MIRNRVYAVSLACSLVLVGSLHAQGSGTKAAAAGSGTKEATLRVQNLEGRSLSFPELVKGKPTLLIFWATWCPSCRQQTPSFQAAFDRFGKKGLNVMAINVGIKDTPAAVKKYAAERKLTLPIYFDADQSATNSFKIAGTPGVLLLDRSGKVVSRSNAVDFDALEALLAGKPIPHKERPAAAGSGSSH